MRRLAAAFALGFSLSACQTLPTPTAPTPSDQAQLVWAAHLKQLSAIDHFALNGRIASSGLGAGPADLSWNQDADHLVVMLTGALGVGALRIEGTPENLVITTRDGIFQADQAEEAIVEKLGAPLPVADLRYWILGIPHPDIPSVIEPDPRGRLNHLQQDGWRIDYIDYRDARDRQPDLPHKLWLSYGNNRWKLVIDQWSITP